MFGYPGIYYPKLIRSELDTYRVHRCTICRNLQRHGYLIALLLSREAVTLGLLLVGQKRAGRPVGQIRCPFRPWRRKATLCVTPEEERFLAAGAMVLGALRLRAIRRPHYLTITAQKVLAPFLRKAINELRLQQHDKTVLEQEALVWRKKQNIEMAVSKLPHGRFASVMPILYANTGRISCAPSAQMDKLRQLGWLVGGILDLIDQAYDRTEVDGVEENASRRLAAKKAIEEALCRIEKVLCYLELYCNHFVLHNILFHGLARATECCLGGSGGHRGYDDPPTLWAYAKSVMVGRNQVSLDACESVPEAYS